MGLEGVARVKGGAFDEGMATIREGLSLALERELTPVAAEVYQRLGTAKEIAGDYPGARDALGMALGLCDATGDGLQHTCLSCMAYVLRELGEWTQAEELCHELIEPGTPPQDTLVADGVLGAIEVWRGNAGRGRALLMRCLETSARLDVVSMQCDSAAALAWLAAHDADPQRAEEHCRTVLERWERSQDHHYAVWGLRWSAGWLASAGRLDLARACTEALSSIAASAGHVDALAALACAIGETALAGGDADVAVAQFARAADLHAGLNIPFERAQILVRAAAALAATGERDAALDHLADAYRTATALGARPLATEAASAVAALGASVADHLGRRAAAEHETAGLSRREVEVVRLVAQGLTNREIAAGLVLSTAHRRHARAQHLRQAAQSHPHRGRRAGGRAGPARSQPRLRSAPLTAARRTPTPTAIPSSVIGARRTRAVCHCGAPSESSPAGMNAIGTSTASSSAHQRPTNTPAPKPTMKNTPSHATKESTPPVYPRAP